jgi:hypothetical protein
MNWIGMRTGFLQARGWSIYNSSGEGKEDILVQDMYCVRDAAFPLSIPDALLFFHRQRPTSNSKGKFEV